MRRWPRTNWRGASLHAAHENISPGRTFFSEQDSGDEEYRALLKRAADLRALRDEKRRVKALALEEAAVLQEPELDVGPRIDDEEVASQVLATMLLVRVFQCHLRPPSDLTLGASDRSRGTCEVRCRGTCEVRCTNFGFGL
jgi:hypothetical protein